MDPSTKLGGHMATAAFSVLSMTIGAKLPEPDVWVEDGCASALVPFHLPPSSTSHKCLIICFVGYAIVHTAHCRHRV